MYNPVTVPKVEGFTRQDRFRLWEHPEKDSEAGLGQVIEVSQLVAGKPDLPPESAPEVYFHRLNVEEGERVGPGKVIAEVMVDGMIVPIEAPLNGLVAGLVDWKEGDRIQIGNIMANVISTPNDGAKKTGLHPKPSQKMYFARTGHFRVH